MEETFDKVRKFINLERKLKLGRGRQMWINSENEKRIMSPYKMVANINKLSQITEEVNGLKILDLRV